MANAKIQHYVPQFLLRNFATRKKSHVWVYDKTTDRSFRTNAKNIASESRFYDFEHEGDVLTLEPVLSKLEARAKPIIADILRMDSVAVLKADDRTALSAFFSVQLVRTRAFRNQWTELPTMLRDHMLSRGETPESLVLIEEFLREPTEDQSKSEMARMIVEAPREYGRHFLAKTWVLAATSRRDPFLISDNPLTLQNMIDRSPRGNLGLAVPGIEIYFPLSPTRALAMWCPSIVAAFRQTADDCAVLELNAALETGKPLQYSERNVENFNSLQVGRSERYLFSAADDFRLARDMITTYPHLKQGDRIQVV